MVGSDIYFLAGDLGADGLGFVGTNSAVYRLPCPCATFPAGACDASLPRAGFDLPVRLTDPENLEFHDLVSTGSGLMGMVMARGVGRPVRVSTAGDVTFLDLPTGTSVAALGASGDVLVGAAVTATSPGELVRLGDTPAVLTDFGAALRAAAPPLPTRELISTSPDGQEIQGWVVLPEGEGPHPVILQIHGGPYAQYAPGFFDESQVLARAGYAVVYCNPRGSASYGQAFGRTIQGDFGNLDRVDVMAFLDHALATVPGLDASRVGVQGGSYGGYLTAWLIAHEHRFSGAIVERAFLDPRSFVGAADIGWFFTHAYNTADPATMDAQSPLLLAGQVKTPTLVLHSEQDLRCPLGPALRYYTELKLAGVETEMLIFPGENHELSRSGTPWHRRQRFEAILAWWEGRL
ncbi:MAG: prolyl oligopeptidase family serine peptidase [Promicromonosporaceae bacterium]|nr:prolyl oligopeptidase family serine peptidase [Promicromonosporaceae bacterium]